MQRNVYLNMVSPDQALRAILEALDRDAVVRPETVPAHLASGRVTAGPVYARASSPTFHSAAMDGIAVRAADTFAAREGRPLELLLGRDYEPVNTGNVLPHGYDAVIMIEHVLEHRHEGEAESALIEKAAFPWQHVRRIGEDIVATELIIPQGRMLTPFDVGALLSAGVFEVPVWERVRMAFIPTGDEVLDFTTRPEPGPGQVIESNSQVLACLADQWGVDFERVAPVPDDPRFLAAALRAALDGGAHIVVLGAGSSAGSKDYSRLVMEEVGQVLVHGMTVMPGKPSIVGLAQGRPVFGAPGYPVSAIVCFERLVRPVADWLGRRSTVKRPEVDVVLTRKAPSRPGMEEWLRLAVGRVGERNVATPLPRGAGQITSLTRAQAVARIPADSEGLEQGAVLRAELLAPEAELERTLVVVGSHDNTLDILANSLMALDPPVRLVSTHVGSMGGLLAIKSGSALAAGAHLFDPVSGDFNFPFIQRHLEGVDVTLVNLAVRHQGLMVAPGNPKGIQGVADLSRDDVVFINRQRGAGTRILLDHHLGEAGIAPTDVSGYGREEFTHMAVAVNVLSGAADCGLGIRAAATALGLDFVPLAKERYDLVIPAWALDEPRDPRIEALLEVVRGADFQDRVRDLGGYETQLTGRVMRPSMGLGDTD